MGLMMLGRWKLHTDKPLVAKSLSFEAEIAIEKLKSYTFPGIGQILTELIQQEANHYFLRSICLFLIFGVRRNFLSNGSSLLLYLFTKNMIKLIVII
jgi:hypothetical protein